MFDFGVLPPEINSGCMYAGPGSGPMLAAATAWDELAVELSTVASGFSSVISELTSAPWVGPSSASMVIAVAPYVSWLSAAAACAEETASQAQAAAAAFDAAFAMTVPPPVIAFNRTLLLALIATNFFGQNNPAIAATEAHYMEMWAQDADAMYGYAASSARAVVLNPFTSPPNTTSSTGVDGQTAATTTAATSQLTSTTTVSEVLQQVSSTATLSSQSTSSSGLPWPLSLLPNPSTPWWQATQADYTTNFHNMFQIYNAYGVAPSSFQMGMPPLDPPGGTTVGKAAGHLTPQHGWSGQGSRPVSVAMGQAGKAGTLSVPQAWPVSMPEASPAVSGAQAAAAKVSPTAAPANNGLLRGMPRGGRRTKGYVHSYGFRHNVIVRPPSGG